VLKYYLPVVLVPLAVAAGVYYSSEHWIYLLFGSWENLDTATKRELLKVAPTAIAAMFGSIVAAVTAVVVVGLQRSATLHIETRKGEILGELEEKKNTLAGDLDTKRQELQHELGLERREIEDKLNRFNEARSTVSDYRYLVQTVRSVGYNNAEEIEPLKKKMIALRDSFEEFPELHKAWAEFYQKGYYLCEQMRPLKTPATRRQVWAAPGPDTPVPLGVEFGSSAQDVLALLGEERARVLTIKKTPATTQSP